MPTTRENFSPRIPVLKSKASLSDKHGGLQLRGSPERFSSTSPQSSPRSATTKSPSSPLKKATLPKSLVNTFSALTVHDQIVARVDIDNTPAFCKIFDKRTPTIPKAPTLRTEQRALKRGHSPEKMADPSRNNRNKKGRRDYYDSDDEHEESSSSPPREQRDSHHRRGPPQAGHERPDHRATDRGREGTREHTPRSHEHLPTPCSPSLVTEATIRATHRAVEQHLSRMAAERGRPRQMPPQDVGDLVEFNRRTRYDRDSESPHVTRYASQGRSKQRQTSRRHHRSRQADRDLPSEMRDLDLGRHQGAQDERGTAAPWHSGMQPRPTAFTSSGRSVVITPSHASSSRSGPPTGSRPYDDRHSQPVNPQPNADYLRGQRITRHESAVYGYETRYPQPRHMPVRPWSPSPVPPPGHPMRARSNRSDSMAPSNNDSESARQREHARQLALDQQRREMQYEWQRYVPPTMMRPQRPGGAGSMPEGCVNPGSSPMSNWSEDSRRQSADSVPSSHSSLFRDDERRRSSTSEQSRRYGDDERRRSSASECSRRPDDSRRQHREQSTITELDENVERDRDGKKKKLPQKDETHFEAKNAPGSRRRKDDDDDQGRTQETSDKYREQTYKQQSSREQGTNGRSSSGKYYPGNYPGERRRDHRCEDKDDIELPCSNAAGTCKYAKLGSSSMASSLNGSAAWFIPQNGRFEQILPREQLERSFNWHKEEGKIPCGFGQRAKFNQGGYRCGM